MKRYHPALVVLHWLLAAMIIAALGMGSFVLEKTPNSDPAKMLSLQLHMSVGLAILALMVIRLLVRWRTAHPPQSDTGNANLNKLAHLTHWGFYALVIAMCISGIAIARGAGLPDIVFGGSGAPLPENFDNLLARPIHGLIAKLIVLLILAHIVGFAYHQFRLKDNLISRMKFGDRRG